MFHEWEHRQTLWPTDANLAEPAIKSISEISKASLDSQLPWREEEFEHQKGWMPGEDAVL